MNYRDRKSYDTDTKEEIFATEDYRRLIRRLVKKRDKFTYPGLPTSRLHRGSRARRRVGDGSGRLECERD